MTGHDARRTRSKAARLLLLYLLQRDGVLNYRGAQTDVAQWLGVHRSTITRDLRQVEAALAIYADLAARQPWIRRQA
jgi:predicted transcriptional regulator YheO